MRVQLNRSSELSWEGIPPIAVFRALVATMVLTSVINRRRWSLNTDGPDDLALVILIDDPAGIGLGCLRDSWKGDSRPLKNVHPHGLLVRMSSIIEVKAAMLPFGAASSLTAVFTVAVCVKSAMFVDPCRDLSRLNRNWREYLNG